jgi:hypothetical protein
MLAYAAGRPVAWVAVAPRADHGRLERSRQHGPGPDDHDVYAVTCFYVDPAERHTGLSDQHTLTVPDGAALRSCLAV